jgi:hypothetical protein
MENSDRMALAKGARRFVARMVCSAFCALGGLAYGGPGFAAGNLIIVPTEPRVGDTVVVSYPQQSCGAEQASVRRNGREFEVTISFNQTCLSAIDPMGNALVQAPGGFYRQVVLGQLPEGNYRVRLYYRDLSQGGSSSSFSMDESFAVMPNR